MTMPHLMNCAHMEDGWCLDCVGQQWEQLQELRAVALEHVPHAYEGDCPDELDRTRRDRNCPACRLLGGA